MNFELISEYAPMGDQPEAIAQLVDGIKNGTPAQTLLGVTGSGKTFTMANVIKEINRPTLILSHNKKNFLWEPLPRKIIRLSVGLIRLVRRNGIWKKTS